VWTLGEKAIKLISEAKKVVSVLDEAFTILALMNYWERWTGNGTARWTDSKAGNYQYMGWADAAYVQFDELCKRIREQRQTRLNNKLEQMYLARSRSLLAGGGPHSQRLGGLVETNGEVYNVLTRENEPIGLLGRDRTSVMKRMRVYTFVLVFLIVSLILDKFVKENTYFG
jgi:hypothetical protein